MCLSDVNNDLEHDILGATKNCGKFQHESHHLVKTLTDYEIMSDLAAWSRTLGVLCREKEKHRAASQVMSRIVWILVVWTSCCYSY